MKQERGLNMEIPIAPEGILYDSRGLKYFEVFKDGSVCLISNDRQAIELKLEDSIYQAYFRASSGESDLYFALSDINGNISIYKVADFDTLADSVGIERPDDHIHNVSWKFNKLDDGKGRYAFIDVEFLCGCKLSSMNSRIMAKQLKKQLGWDIVLSSINSIPSSEKTIKVERKSLTGSK